MNFKTHLKHISKIEQVMAFRWGWQHILTYLIVESERTRYYLILTFLNVRCEVIDGEIHSQMSL